MKLRVLGSGSSGNCYLLESDTECLVIEAGIPFKAVKKALNFNVSKIVGVVVSHSHKDHAGYYKEYINAGIPVYRPYDMNEEIARIQRWFGEFGIKPFENRSKSGKWLHNNTDDTECRCHGFYVYHPEMGKIVYASDTECIRWKFPGVSHVLVEANYSIDLVDRDEPNYEHQLRGHMSIDTTCRFLMANNGPDLRNVILCHLSGQSADPERFRELAQKEVNCPVYVAEKGLEVELRQEPF